MVDFAGGLLPLENIEELRFEAETGFFYVKQTTKTTHKFELAGKLVSYAEKVEGYLQPYRIKHLAGVKAKELFNIWAPIGDISVDDPPTGKIHFKSYGGVGKSFPVKAFEPGQ